MVKCQRRPSRPAQTSHVGGRPKALAEAEVHETSAQGMRLARKSQSRNVLRASSCCDEMLLRANRERAIVPRWNKRLDFPNLGLEAPPGFEPGMEVLQIS